MRWLIGVIRRLSRPTGLWELGKWLVSISVGARL